MTTLNQIGLDVDQSKKIADQLNKLLANYQIFYMNTRSFHWNIKGDTFFELHSKFEELYNDSLIKIDEIAERILTLGSIPLHTYNEYIEGSDIQTVKYITNGREAVTNILRSLKTLLPIERKLFDLSEQAGDEGTNSLMSDYIAEQEKLVWMYSAYLET